VTHGQCDARPTVIFPAAERHRPLTTDTKLYCLVNKGTCANNLPKVVCYLAVPRLGVEPATSGLPVRHDTVKPPSDICKKTSLKKLSCRFFLRARASQLAIARVSYGNSVCLSVRPSRPGTVSKPVKIETSGFQYMIA